MQVELDRTLLDPRTREDLALLALCAFGLGGRHRVVPDDRDAWERWAEALPVDLGDEVRLVWDEGERRVAVGAASERMQVAPGNASRFDTTPLVLTPREALALLGRPLRVLLENGRNDRAFLLAFADDATHATLSAAEQEGWLVFETAGGIGELLVRARAAPESPAREVFRTMYLCDSDAREPRAPSREAATVQQALAELATRYGRPANCFGAVLSRRAAENYAPPSAVLTWACQHFGRRAASVIEQATTAQGRAMLAGDTGEPASERRRLLAAVALRELQPAARGFVDMKWGRLKDGAIRTTDVVWDPLDAFQQAVLTNGFGAGFSADFYDGQRNLHDETGEIGALLATLLERL